MKIIGKIKWIAGILLVFFIVLFTNVIDRENFNRLSYSVTTMYEDRIVASDLLFDMSAIIQEKQVAILTQDTLFFKNQNAKHNQDLSQLIEYYSVTKLTEKEKLVFNQLQSELNRLQQAEGASADLPDGSALQHIGKIEQHLHELSKIQVQEGKRQVSISNQVKDTVNLFTQGEIVFLIIMAVLVQVIILYKPKG